MKLWQKLKTQQIKLINEFNKILGEEVKITQKFKYL